MQKHAALRQVTSNKTNIHVVLSPHPPALKPGYSDQNLHLMQKQDSQYTDTVDGQTPNESQREFGYTQQDELDQVV